MYIGYETLRLPFNSESVRTTINNSLTMVEKMATWHHNRQLLRVRNTVLNAENNVTRNKWKMEKNCAIDGITRTVKLKTAASMMKQPTLNLHLIEPLRNASRRMGVHHSYGQGGFKQQKEGFCS
ncbi:hypothetical protein T06_5323 [Trichinella sp. T6]|nr:hypothetical protein T06_5323 [Trichinella sp. T6]